MEHFITSIIIKELRHLSNIKITLNPEKRQHLILTGRNGSGKTSLLLAIQEYLRLIPTADNRGVLVQLSSLQDIHTLYKKGDFITAFFPADRKSAIQRANGVEEIRLEEFYSIDSDPGILLQKYMVHLKTQQAYARNEEDSETVERIQKWFDRFVDALRILLDDETLSLEYDYKEYDFKIYEKGRKPFHFDELSDGYSSVIRIVSNLLLRMEKNWLYTDALSTYDTEGIVLIDELETHLHLDLQKKILPFLTEFFPKIQFIVSTHSPYILNSISNSKAYDLETCVELENLSMYTSEGLAEGYFDADEYSEELKKRLNRYLFMMKKSNLTDEERAERASLRLELKKIPRQLSPEIVDAFERIEGQKL